MLASDKHASFLTLAAKAKLCQCHNKRKKQKYQNGAMTISIMTNSVMTLSKTTIITITLRIMTLKIITQYKIL